MNEKIYAFENEEKNKTGNETVIQQKKFLDAEGVKYLWSKINMQDYPNNQTLMQVIEAIDETKADINLQNIELTDEEINELKFKLKIPESSNYIYLGDITSDYGYMCNMLSGIENYITIPPSYEQNHPNALSEMLAGMSAAVLQVSNKVYKNILPRITLNYPKLREAGMSNFIQFYFYTYNKNKKQCGSVEAVNLTYNIKKDIYTLSRISKINSLVSYGFLKFDGNNNILHDATERFDDTFTNDYVPASSGAIGRALNEKANKSDLFNGSWNDLENKPTTTKYQDELLISHTDVENEYYFDLPDKFHLSGEHTYKAYLKNRYNYGYITISGYESTNMLVMDLIYKDSSNNILFTAHGDSSTGKMYFTNLNDFNNETLIIYSGEELMDHIIPDTIARTYQIPEVPVTSVNGMIGDVVIDLDGYVESSELFNENNIIKQNVLPEGYPYASYGIILPETTLEVDVENQLAVVVDKIALVAGFPYDVTYNGTTYSCISQVLEIEGMQFVVLGNAAPIGGEESEEPFLIANVDDNMAAMFGGYIIIMPMDSSETITLSISGAKIQKMNSAFMPEDVITNIINGSNLGSVRSLFAAKDDDEYTIGENAIAFGQDTKASGFASHAEGGNTTASDRYSHAEGENTTASGYTSHAEGSFTTASGFASHAEGQYTTASGHNSHVQGKYNIEDTTNKYAHIVGNGTGSSKRSNAHTLDWNGVGWFQSDLKVGGTSQNDPKAKSVLLKGDAVGRDVSGMEYTIDGNTVVAANGAEVFNNYMNNKASGSYSHAEGEYTTASGTSSHAEGEYTTASGTSSHAEGRFTTASGYTSHAEGSFTTASGISSHAEGDHTTASGRESHAEGSGATASGNQSHAEGDYTTASGDESHAEGQHTKASGNQSHAEGRYTIASGEGSHAEGVGTKASDNCSHAEGYDTIASGYCSHAEGQYTAASGSYSHAEGHGDYPIPDTITLTSTNKEIIEAWKTTEKFMLANGKYSHVEGNSNLAIGDTSHAEGCKTLASGNYSHTEGENTTASGYASHAEGTNTTASSLCSHAEGASTTASGNNSHAEGSSTTASGSNSHAEGYSTIASGHNSHAEGYSTTASSNYSHVQGVYNIEDTGDKYAHIVGNGNTNNHSNAHTLDWDGNAWFSGNVYVGSTSGTNRDEGSVKLARISDIPEELTEDEALQILIECEVIDPVADENSNILLEQNNTILIY